jgi:5-methylcytosine-specific restriction endonuclease McrA
MDDKTICRCGKCKVCRRRITKARWNNANAEKEKERKHRRYLANQEEDKRKAHERWITKGCHNPEVKRLSYRRYYAKNKEKELERSRVKTANRSAQKKSTGNITMNEWEEVKRKYNYTCLCCGRREPEIRLSLDHVVPLRHGGPNVISNVQPLCMPCNFSKRDKTIDYR